MGIIPAVIIAIVGGASLAALIVGAIDCMAYSTRCAHCKNPGLFVSQVSGKWQCENCKPCWCLHCNGRVNAHDSVAVALYQAQADAARASLE